MEIYLSISFIDVHMIAKVLAIKKKPCIYVTS